jgi:hypothetical protein
MRAVGASDRVFQLLDRMPDMNIVGGKKLDEINGLIEFNKERISINSFSYKIIGHLFLSKSSRYHNSGEFYNHIGTQQGRCIGWCFWWR